MKLKVWQYIVIAILSTGFIVGGYYGLSMVGCAPTTPITGGAAQASITGASTTTGTVATDVGNRAGNIDKDAGVIASTVTPADQAKIQTPLAGIQTETNGLRADQGQLIAVQSQLAIAQQADAAKDKQITDLTKQVTSLTAAQKSLLQRLMAIIIIIGVLGLGAGGALIYLEQVKIGIAVLIGSAISVAVAVLLLQYAVWVAIGAGVLILGAIGYIVYLLVKNKGSLSALKVAHAALTAQHAEVTATLAGVNKQILVANGSLNQHKLAIQQYQTAMVQVTQTCEATKHAMPVANKQYLFGAGAIPGVADIYQNSVTQVLVSRARQSVRKAPDTSKLVPPRELVQPIVVAPLQTPVAK
jgi:hypothetical protein